MRRLLLLALMLCARPVYAQVDVRPFALFADEHLAASTTFNATAGTDTAPFWGGGVDVIVGTRVFVDLTVSHMSRDGHRAFINNGQVFDLGIPLRVTSTPIEVAGGYRFRFGRSRVVPYAGAGVGSYSYRETSDFSQAGDDVDVRHAGVLIVGGVEFRVSRWVSVSGDAQYTHVPGILGQGGLSKDANENDFGGVAGRLRVVIGR